MTEPTREQVAQAIHDRRCINMRPGYVCRCAGPRDSDYAEADSFVMPLIRAGQAESPVLLPVESMALTTGLAQAQRGEAPMENVAAMCVLALARITGKHDWTQEHK